jgi:hypothetical protein
VWKRYRRDFVQTDGEGQTVGDHCWVLVAFLEMAMSGR